MKITLKQIMDIAELSKLSFTESEANDMLGLMRSAIEFADTLDGLNTGGAEPMPLVTQLVNVTREDTVIKDFSREEILMNAALRDEQCIIVPKVLG